jgi:predicted RNase H-like nuclease (RuvC/YqgF family)
MKTAMELIDEVAALAAENARLRSENAAMTAGHERLCRQHDALKENLSLVSAQRDDMRADNARLRGEVETTQAILDEMMVRHNRISALETDLARVTAERDGLVSAAKKMLDMLCCYDDPEVNWLHRPEPEETALRAAIAWLRRALKRAGQRVEG